MRIDIRPGLMQSVLTNGIDFHTWNVINVTEKNYYSVQRLAQANGSKNMRSCASFCTNNMDRRCVFLFQLWNNIVTHLVRSQPWNLNVQAHMYAYTFMRCFEVFTGLHVRAPGASARTS